MTLADIVLYEVGLKMPAGGLVYLWSYLLIILFVAVVASLTCSNKYCYNCYPQVIQLQFHNKIIISYLFVLVST